MPIFSRTTTGLGDPAGPLRQAEAELGSAVDAAAKPPPKSNGAGKSAGKTTDSKATKDRSTEIETAEIAVDDAVETDPVAPGPDSPLAALATGQAPNPLASAIALMTASAPHRHLFISDLEWALLPPVALRQCRVFVKDARPVGFASWAFVSDEVDARLKTGQPRLKRGE